MDEQENNSEEQTPAHSEPQKPDSASSENSEGGTPAVPSKVTPPPAQKPSGAVDIGTTTISRTSQEAGQSTVPPAGPGTQTDSMDRRSFVKWLTIGWAAFAAIVAGYGTLILRFLFPNVLFEPKQSFRAGFPGDYQVGLVSERWKAQHAVWIVRDAQKIYALSTICTHLGCTPNWLENENKFKCPCHGSGFYKTGINFEGPAPRPLERFKIALSDDGEIIVDKTRKFQQEKGEWSDPDSFLLV